MFIIVFVIIATVGSQIVSAVMMIKERGGKVDNAENYLQASKIMTTSRHNFFHL